LSPGFFYRMTPAPESNSTQMAEARAHRGRTGNTADGGRALLGARGRPGGLDRHMSSYSRSSQLVKFGPIRRTPKKPGKGESASGCKRRRGGPGQVCVRLLVGEGEEKRRRFCRACWKRRQGGRWPVAARHRLGKAWRKTCDLLQKPWDRRRHRRGDFLYTDRFIPGHSRARGTELGGGNVNKKRIGEGRGR